MKKYEATSANNEGIEKIVPKGIIAGGPGIGKSTFAEEFDSKLSVKDIDPSPYREDPTWPENYIADIVANTENFDLLLISTHPDVVQILRERGFKVTVVCPDESLRVEYENRLIARAEKRIKERGDASEESLKKAREKARWLSGMGIRPNEENIKNFAGGKIIFLQAGQYLSDIIDSAE
jgi:hypothetical protein